MLVIGAKLKSAKNTKTTEGYRRCRGMYKNKMAVTRYKIRTYDAHDKRSMIHVCIGKQQLASWSVGGRFSVSAVTEERQNLLHQLL